MSEDAKLSPLGAEMVAGLSAFRDALESGEPIEKRFPVRTVHLNLDHKRYQAADLKKVRADLNASQPLLARFLVVSVKALRAWEQGIRPIPRIVSRFLDEIVDHPDVWKRRIRESAPAGPEV